MAKGKGASNSVENKETLGFVGIVKFSPNIDALMQVQRRNAEVCTQAGQQTFQDMQALTQRHFEMMRESWEDATRLFAGMFTPASPREKIASQTEIARSAMEKAVANGKELVEMATSCQRHATEMMALRMTEAFDEFRSVYTRR